MKTHANVGINFTAVFISVLSITARAEDCNELLRLGYMNVNHSVSQYDSVVSAYNHFCSTSYNSASSDKKRGLQTSFDYLKTISGSLGFSWGKTLTQETWSQICEDKNTYNKLSTYQSADSSEISNSALSAWQNCLTLNARGLKSDFNMTQDLTGLTGTLYWTGSTPITFLGVDNIGLGKASCNVTAYIGNKYVTKPVTSDTTFKLTTKAANFNCQRSTDLDELNRITAQVTRLTFKTSEGKLDVDLAPIMLTQIDGKQINDLYMQIDNLRQRTEILNIVDTGTVNHSTNELEWNLFSGTGIRSNSYHISFNKNFSTPPTVSLGMNIIDSDSSKFTIAANNITTTGFDLSFSTWNAWKVASLGASWFAVGN